jgi:hypothetical protein
MLRIIEAASFTELILAPRPPAAKTNLLINGSFGTGDFCGWRVLNGGCPPSQAVGAVGGRQWTEVSGALTRRK